MEPIRFSQLNKDDKLLSVCKNTLQTPNEKYHYLKSFWHSNPILQRKFDELSENTISNYYFPYSVIPDVLMDGKLYTVPIAIEESSVVAAASKAAKFWLNNGGIQTKILGITKIGQIHFIWGRDKKEFELIFAQLWPSILEELSPIISNMQSRGGGVLEYSINHLDKYSQIKVFFDTKDSMGANFINSVLESINDFLKKNLEGPFESIFSIVSNYTPDCLVQAKLEAPVDKIPHCEKMLMAYEIANLDIYRATTHNKGIMNGIDGVAIATGNDFRAIEACAHAYAVKDGKYTSLSSMEIIDNKAIFSLTIPLAVGTIGGISKIHSLAQISLEILSNPSAQELMRIMASIGLIQNFAAVSSLVSTGIQKGHMKMHLVNILHQLNGTPREEEMAKNYFKDKTISFSKVREYISSIRTIH